MIWPLIGSKASKMDELLSQCVRYQSHTLREKTSKHRWMGPIAGGNLADVLPEIRNRQGT